MTNLPAVSIDLNTPPDETLEESLLRVGKMEGVDWYGDAHKYPKDGAYKGDMEGFIQSCKVMTQDIIASGKAPMGLDAVDIFALHLYTRAELFCFINAAYRDGKDLDEMEKWRVVVWYMMKAQTKVKAVPGLYFRGVNDNFFKHHELKTIVPGRVLTFSSFSSTTSDLRVATAFMHGNQDLSQVRGVVFKIWSYTPVPISWCSFVPKESEFLYNPNTSFLVRNWYEASQVNLRAGIRESVQPGECTAFKFDCGNIVHPVPLNVVATEEELTAQLAKDSAKVLVIELEEQKKVEEKEP